ncbi:MAG: hypothetical protein Q9181_000271 [Wetmoreana brouardii]
MPSTAGIVTPGLSTFLGSIKGSPVETSIEQLVSLLKRRQVRGSRPCAVATAHLLRRVVGASRVTDVAKLVERIQHVGARIVAAQPKEMTVGNIVRRVLRVIRDEAEENREGEANAFDETGKETTKSNGATTSGNTTSSPTSSAGQLRRSEVARGNTGASLSAAGPNAPTATSLFSLLSQPSLSGPPPFRTPGDQFPRTSRSAPTATDRTQDLKREVIEGIEEIIDELSQVDDQIASYALDHVHSNEVVLTNSTSIAVQKFLLKAAGKRKFTVVCAEALCGDQQAIKATVPQSTVIDDDKQSLERFHRLLNAAGVTVVLVPDSAIFAVMSRVTKVVLDAHVALADGGLVAPAGARMIAKAATMHRTPVVVLSGIYQLSPVHVFDTEALIEYGDPSSVIPFAQGGIIEKLDLGSPIYDYVPANIVDLYITNIGGHAPSFLYRIAADHYQIEDVNLTKSAA